MNNPTPRCCGSDARWINNGPALQYFFCDECKQEVGVEPTPTELQGLEQKPSPFSENKSVHKWAGMWVNLGEATAKHLEAQAKLAPAKWPGPPIAKRHQRVDAILKEQTFTKQQIDDIVRPPLCKSGHKMSVTLDCCLDCGVSYAELTK